MAPRRCSTARFVRWWRRHAASAPSAFSTPAGSAPVLYRLASDLADVPTMIMLVAAIVLVALPLAWRFGPDLHAVAARRS